MVFAKTSQGDNNTQDCIPWFFPTPDNLDVYVCDPWKTVKFLDFMKQVPGDYCPCLPDCSATIYEPFIISTPFRRCDSSNFGVSRLCNPNSKEIPQPTMYGSQVRAEFQAKHVDTPLFKMLESSVRNYTYEIMFEQNPKSYDAYDKDIAVVEIFYRKSTIFQMGTKATMTWIDYFSTVGGLLGLVLGMGFISFIELVWLCCRIAALKMNFQNWIP